VFINGNYKRDFTALKEYSQAGFTGLTKDVLKPLEVALEHTKNIDRFWNDSNVDTENFEFPSLYDHIFSGLALAKEDIFRRVEKLKVAQVPNFQKKLKDFATKFNRAFLVHDFGEMFMEFSTVFGRFDNRESKALKKKERDQTERSIAELVFNAVEILNPKWFSKFFSEKSKHLINTDEYDAKIDLAKQFLNEGRIIAKKWRSAIPDSVAELDKFVKIWMEDFDISQNVDSLRNSFIGNLVKVVDKLEDVWRASKIHNPKKLTDEFRQVLISSYMKAYRRLKECTEAKQIQKESVEAAVLKQVDRLIKARFKKDNNAIADDSQYKFRDLDQAYEVATLVAV
jgi:hypothetical protein